MNVSGPSVEIQESRKLVQSLVSAKEAGLVDASRPAFVGTCVHQPTAHRARSESNWQSATSCCLAARCSDFTSYHNPSRSTPAINQQYHIGPSRGHRRRLTFPSSWAPRGEQELWPHQLVTADRGQLMAWKVEERSQGVNHCCLRLPSGMQPSFFGVLVG
jgi:hypothetical protein